MSAAYLTTAFLVGAVGAWHVMKDRANPRARLMFSMAMWVAAVVAPLILFGVPNSAEGRVDYAVEIPKLSSLIPKHDLNAPMRGLDSVPAADQPPVGIVFWAFRIMVGLGFLMAGLGMLSLWARVTRHPSC